MLTDYYHNGHSARLWYDETWEFLQQEFQQDAKLVAGMLAVTSPNATVQANVTLALRAYRQWQSGEAFEGYLGTVKLALRQLVSPEPVVLGGPKIRCFYENLTGNLTPVTVDRWIARALGKAKNPANEREYMQMSLQVAEFAKIMGEEPARAQAAIWQGIRHAEQTKFDYGDMRELLWAARRQKEIIWA